MGPHRNAVAEQVLGTMGTVCWTVQLIPQVWKSYRSKSTTGLSHWLVLLWGVAAVFLGVYNVAQRLNVPLMVQPQLFGFLSFLSWGQCQYYGLRRSKKVAALMTLAIMISAGVIELAMVLALQSAPAQSRSRERGTQFFGIFASVVISAGLLPQYWEIYKFKEVIGISLIFMTVDLLGGVFSLLSLVFKDRFDVIAGVAYSAVVVLDGVVIIAALILNPLAKKRRRREAEKRQLEAEHDGNTSGDTTLDSESPSSTSASGRISRRILDLLAL